MYILYLPQSGILSPLHHYASPVLNSHCRKCSFTTSQVDCANFCSLSRSLAHGEEVL